MKSILEKIPNYKYIRQGELMNVFEIAKMEGLIYEFFEFLPNKKYKEHYHKKSTGTFYIVSGSGKITIGGKEKSYKKGSIFKIPRKTWHGFKVKSRTLLFSIQTNPITKSKKGQDIYFKK